MLTVTNIVTPSAEQWEAVIRGMRNPHDSWDKSDSEVTWLDEVDCPENGYPQFFMGNKDRELALSLAGGGSTHAKYRRMIPLYMDIEAPLYWWKEFDTYKVGTVANSCSTMHTITKKEITLDNFSVEDLSPRNRSEFKRLVSRIEANRKAYLSANQTEKPDIWRNIIQMLPSSFNQKRTVFMNYEVAHAIVCDRSNHKLKEWRQLVDILKDLPYSELFDPMKATVDILKP